MFGAHQSVTRLLFREVAVAVVISRLKRCLNANKVLVVRALARARLCANRAVSQCAVEVMCYFRLRTFFGNSVLREL